MAEKIRNIALAGHGGAGKTSLAESMLFKAGVIKRMGRVEDGNTTLDFHPEEIKRQTSITSSFFQYSWKKKNINIIDTPGDQNFFSSTKTSMQAADGVAIVIDAVDGIKVRTEQTSEFVKEFNLPSLVFVNKLDRERADLDRTLEGADNLLEQRLVNLHIPIGKEDDFKGFVDLVSMKAYIYNDGKPSLEDIPADLADAAEEARELFIETVAEADDDLIEKYLEGEELSSEEINAAMKKGICESIFTPLLVGSVSKDIGVDYLSDFIINCMPLAADNESVVMEDDKGEEIERKIDENEPFAAYVFKTVIDPYAGRLSIFKILSGTLKENDSFYNTNKETVEKYTNIFIFNGKATSQVSEAGPGSIVAVAKLKDTETGNTICAESSKVICKCAESISPSITFSLSAKSKKDEDKLFSSLSKIIEEDQALVLDRNAETKEILLSGLGLVHVETAVGILKDQFGVEVVIDTPKIPYKETIKKKIRVQGKHKKQSGGHGQYGDCWVTFEPMKRSEGFQFVDAIVGGKIPKTYIPAVEAGIKEASLRGIIAGFPCVDFKATVDDGSYHNVDSSEMAFKLAGSMAFKNASANAGPVLLGPILKIETFVPDEYMGDAMGDMNSRRGRVLGMEQEGKMQVITAHVPMSEVQKYSPDLTSMTGGRGYFKTEFSHYDEVPRELSDKIIAEINAENE